jgi:membrane protein DedA with SNARE-associated domain
MTIRQILRFFIKYKYEAIFPIAFLEGPIITIISGVLVSRGRLALLPTLIVVFLGDFFSDIVFHIIGRGGRTMIDYLKFLHITPEQLVKLEDRFHNHPMKTMIVAKISYGLGAVFMIASGASRMIWKKFLGYISGLNLIRSSILLAIGYYFGRSALRNGSIYLQYYVIGIILIALVWYLVSRKEEIK